MRYCKSMFLIASVFILSSCETLRLEELLANNSQGLSSETIAKGLKEALLVGTKKSVNRLSAPGGFYNSPKNRINIPENLRPVTDTLKKIGMGAMVTDFQHKMNIAAEQASAKAAPIFAKAVRNMSFDDARKILTEKGTPATEYLKRTTSGDLGREFKPIIQKTMKEVGVYSIYEQLMSRYDMIPFKNKPKFDLTDYITQKTLSALFSNVATEERLIRKDPAARTTELLRKVFSSNSQ